ncbi:MAG: hypothetical protein A2Y62_20465 [Candidatus Fischerbacteria bacterium RBG_13_37_8]|uniref:Bulb-type lectin domain-containing protein n=1 Tax=Candidatus Fischerbacteria bacterium RBG_13_37_8 TaxID=1817863 RepID=A0A1F5VX20_9BACT|nr:MAG: hypothetical protein A2Y62_20465 [Candidatus Fischerbacteria bacterium RBG_13_37_8]
MKIDATGSILWQKTYGGADDDFPFFIQQTSDGGYIVAGNTMSFGLGSTDAWALKLDSTGNISWQKTYGGTADEDCRSVRQTADGGYILGGYTRSYGAGDADVWMIKLDSTGNISWQKTYGDTGYDSGQFIQQTIDGGFIITGSTSSFGSGNNDFLILKINSTGNMHSSCTFISDSSASPIDSTASAADTTISLISSTAAATNTNVSSVNGTGIDSPICESQSS